MRAVLYDSFQHAPSLVTVADPACPDAGAVIEVVATGLCRSDWHGWMGHDPDIRLPHVPGHELTGVVAEVGPLVRDWSRGDRVTVPFVCACGDCDTCRRGEHQVCERQFQPGFTAWGSFAELVAIDRADVNLVRIPDGVDFETAASLGCRFASAYRAVVHHGHPDPGDWVVVHGCGGVGLSAVMIAAAHGARVMAVDVSVASLRLAEDVGATVTVNAAECDVVAVVRNVTGGGAQVSIDALGSVTTCQNSIDCLRTRGRHVQVGLMVAEDDMPRVPMAAVIARELEVLGSHGMAAHAYPAMLAEIVNGSLAPQILVRRRIGLDEAGDALAAMNDRPTPGITMIRVSGAR
jgi:D-arabinose 1-dehydrogenase-like Zn-dependent alcohol dehydrogenase